MACLHWTVLTRPAQLRGTACSVLSGQWTPNQCQFPPANFPPYNPLMLPWSWWVRDWERPGVLLGWNSSTWTQEWGVSILPILPNLRLMMHWTYPLCPWSTGGNQPSLRAAPLSAPPSCSCGPVTSAVWIMLGRLLASVQCATKRFQDGSDQNINEPQGLSSPISHPRCYQATSNRTLQRLCNEIKV